MTRFIARGLFLSAIAAAVATAPALSQQAEATRPVPYPVIPPAQYRDAIANGTRTHTGEPGPSYWQQWADYTIRGRLVPGSKRVEGEVEIIYHNQSPDTLSYVALHLLQNLHAEGAARGDEAEVTGGVELGRVAASGSDLATTEWGLQQDGIYESNPVSINRGVRIATHVLAPAVVYWTTEKMHQRGRKKLALALRIGLMVAYSYAAMHNIRTVNNP